MKISLLTIHFGVNHGSILQTIATYHTLVLMGHDVEIINYIPDRYNFFREVMKKRKNFILKLGYFLLNFIKVRRRRRIFSVFLEKYCKVSRRVRNVEKYFNNHKPDIALIGSDQVWNSDYNVEHNTNYFLENVFNLTIISYASSFGKDVVDDQEIAKIIPLLKRFSSISVRELSAVKILEKYGIYSELVLDPTLLLNQDYWSNYMESIHTSYEKYILIYVMDQSYEPLVKIANQIKNLTGYNIIMVSFEKYTGNNIDKSYFNISPGQFLQLFKQCSYVVTNSYHGTLFSINFSKDFYVVRKAKYNTRIENILDIVNLSNRLIDEKITISDYKKIDYNSVKNILDIHKNKSMNYIRRSLGE